MPTPLSAPTMDILDWAGKAAVALGAIKVFLSGIYKPFVLWRKEHAARTIRAVLAPELTQLQSIINDETGCASRMEQVIIQMRQIFQDLDMFVEIASDNRERLDEVNGLLDAVGFNAERRVDIDQRDRITSTMLELTERRRNRRRALLNLADKEST